MIYPARDEELAIMMGYDEGVDQQNKSHSPHTRRGPWGLKSGLIRIPWLFMVRIHQSDYLGSISRARGLGLNIGEHLNPSYVDPHYPRVKFRFLRNHPASGIVVGLAHMRHYEVLVGFWLSRRAIHRILSMPWVFLVPI